MAVHEAQPDHSHDPDTQAVQAGHRVGTKVLFENDRVRVWELVLRPGEESPQHEHACDYVFVHLTRSKIALLEPDKEPQTDEEPAGFVQYTEVGGGIVHSIKNVGDCEHREILVELKGPSRAHAPQPPQTNEALLRREGKDPW